MANKHTEQMYFDKWFAVGRGVSLGKEMFDVS